MTASNLQVALDTIDLSMAVSVATQTVDLVDRIEIGTPLLRKHGVRAIEELRGHCKDAVLVADLKTMDYGHLETRLAIEAGANGVVVQAAASRPTLEAACSCAVERDAFVMVDGIGIPDIADLARRISGLEVRNVIIHKAKDEQNRDGPLAEFLDASLVPSADLPPLAIAGGITPRNVHALLSAVEIDTIIVGSAIMSSPSPRDVTMEFLSVLNRGDHDLRTAGEIAALRHANHLQRT
jgi:3-hexulose-6-phosphate synthase / 6-phospho-3-hexuloisomerase